MIETLQCEAGHSWEREAVRGKKPTRCPEHRPKRQGKKRKVADPLAKARKAKQKKIDSQEQTVIKQADAILADPNMQPELKRKLRYCQDELQRRKSGNLTQRRTELIREAQKARP